LRAVEQPCNYGWPDISHPRYYVRTAWYIPSGQDRDSGVELIALEAKILLEGIEASLCDAGAIEIVEKVENPQHRKQGTVKNPHELLLLGLPVRIIESEDCLMRVLGTFLGIHNFPRRLSMNARILQVEVGSTAFSLRAVILTDLSSEVSWYEDSMFKKEVESRSQAQGNPLLSRKLEDEPTSTCSYIQERKGSCSTRNPVPQRETPAYPVMLSGASVRRQVMDHNVLRLLDGECGDMRGFAEYRVKVEAGGLT
jgi:hypothetical protein